MRNQAGEFDVAVENLAVAGERINAFLNPCAARVVDGDDGNADVGGGFHHVADFLRVHAPQRATGDGEILREGGHWPPVYIADAGDDAVTGHLAAIHAGGVVIHMHAGFLKRAFVVKTIQTLSGIHQAFLSALLHFVLTAAGDCLFPASHQLVHQVGAYCHKCSKVGFLGR